MLLFTINFNERLKDKEIELMMDGLTFSTPGRVAHSLSYLARHLEVWVRCPVATNFLSGTFSPLTSECVLKSSPWFLKEKLSVLV